MPNGDGSVGLRAHANDRYVTAGSGPLIASAATLGAAESFQLIPS